MNKPTHAGKWKRNSREYEIFEQFGELWAKIDDEDFLPVRMFGLAELTGNWTPIYENKD